jgi:hypothetical protein
VEYFKGISGEWPGAEGSLAGAGRCDKCLSGTRGNIHERTARRPHVPHRIAGREDAERVEVFTGDVLPNLDDPATWRRALREARERDRGARVWSRLPA